MKVTITDTEERTVLTDVQEINVTPYGDVAITKADETTLFKLDEDTQLRIRVEPEPMNTRLKSAASVVLATLPDCERCRIPDVLLPCSCGKWCGLDICLVDDLRTGPSVLDPISGDLWDKDRDAEHEAAQEAATEESAG